MKFKYLYIIILILALIPFVNATAPVSNFSSNVTTGPYPLPVLFTDDSSNTPTGWAWFFGDETYTQTWSNFTGSGPGWLCRSQQTSVVLPDGSLVMMGGVTVGGTAFGDVWRTTTNGTTWTQQNASAWSARYGSTSVVLSNGTIVFMGGVTSGGVRQNDTWVSSDKGGNWTRVNLSSGWQSRLEHVSLLLPDGSIVLIGGNINISATGRVNDTWRSTDNGVTWTLMNASSTWLGRKQFGGVVMQDGSIVITGGLATSGNKNDTWRSTDNGATWTQQNASAAWTARYGFSTIRMPDDSILLMGGNDGSMKNDIWRSTDKGITWTQITAGAAWIPRLYATTNLLPNGSIILVGGQGGTNSIWKNDTWAVNPSGSLLQNPAHTFSPVGNFSIALQSYNTDGYNVTLNKNYINTTAPIKPVADFSANVTSGPPNAPILFTDSSTNTPTGWAWFFGDESYNQSWTQQNASSGWAGRFFHNTVILSDGSTLLFGGNSGATYYGDVWRSTNDGLTWTLTNSTTSGWGTRYAMTSVVLQNGDIILMGGYTTTYKNDTWKSTDKGISWTQQNASSGWSARLTPSAVVLPDNSIVIMGGNTGTSTKNDTWRSTDGGVTWVQQNISAPFPARYSATAQVLQNGDIVYMGGGNFGGPTVFYNDVWKSADKGITWTRVNDSAGWSGRYGLSSVVMPDNSLIIMGGSLSNTGLVLSNEVWRSSNGGSTWTRINASAGWVARNGLTSVISETGNIIVTGGLNATYRNDAWAFYPASDNSKNPVHTYSSGGTYNVALTSYNLDGYNTSSKPSYISMVDKPAPDFTSNITTSTVYPLVVRFNDTSQNLPTEWNWSFGDGRWFNTTNSSLKNTTYQYAVAGKYNVSLQERNGNGTNSTTKNNWINLTSDYDSNVTSWLHMNGTNGATTFTDETGLAWSRFGNAQITTSTYKYGGASGSFDGAGDYISTPSSAAINLTTSDFTIEFWMNVTAITGTNDHIVSKTNNPRNRGWGFDCTGGNDAGWDFWMGNDSGGQVFVGTSIPNKTWNHIVIERISGTIYIYVNGTLTNSSSGFNANYGTQDPLWIARQNTEYFNGYLDEFRISNGYARWKSNFTPPYDEYRGLLETVYPDINPNSTFRYKTDPTGIAYVDNKTPRNRTIQIQNITNTSYVVGEAIFDPIYTYVKSVQLNLSYYPTGMSLVSYHIDNEVGLVSFNISKPTGFTPGTARASIFDYTIAYTNYTDGTDPIADYFAYGYLVNGSTNKSYSVHNFLGTPVTYGDWNFTANFTATNRTVSIGQPTTFNATFNGSYPNMYNWSFGDGTFDNDTNITPTHIYTSNGNKTISLTEYLWQNGSISNTMTITDYISVGDPPVANFTMTNQTGMYQLIVRLNDTSTNIPTAWNWSVDGTNYSSIQNPVYTLEPAISNWTNYTTYLNFTIVLNASNIFGSSCATQYANISLAPITNFTMNTSTGPEPLAIQFTDISGYGPIIEWNWSFGDLPGNYSAISNPVYTFNQDGIYNVTLYTRNLFGTNATWMNVTVITQPVANFSMSNDTSNIPLVINFTEDSTHFPTSWNWSFGDGNYSDIQNPTYIFNYAGNYTVTLNASNSVGSNYVTHYANATQGIAPIASFIMNSTSGGSPLAIQFNDTSVNSPDKWNWSFGNGLYSDEQNPNYTFISIGNYTVTLNASNTLGSSIATRYAEVLGPPTALFTTNTTTGGEPLGVNFTDISTSNPTAWNWSFKNVAGNNTQVWFSTLQNPEHSFFVGNYTIKLNASNAYGHNITPDDYWINVSLVTAPIADFASTSTGGPYPPVNVQFNDTSINFPTQWNWSFGDGNVSALQNPLHNYTFCGNFSVLLRVENGMGVSWKNTTDYVGIACAPIPPTPDERIAMRMADIGTFVVIAAIILVIALVATFIYMWAKRRS